MLSQSTNYITIKTFLAPWPMVVMASLAPGQNLLLAPSPLPVSKKIRPEFNTILIYSDEDMGKGKISDLIFLYLLPISPSILL